MRPADLLGVAWLAAASAAPAQEADEHPFKLTLGDYRYHGYDGQDVNLRWRRDDTSVWLGHYHDRAFGSQTRAGADVTFALAEQASLQPSLQWATGGFVGGSITLQAGDPWFGLLGWGRTDLKPYFNLNFDPNDAVTLGAGHRDAAGRTFTLFVVADDRLHTGQRHWHFNARWPVGGVRATFDVLRKTGSGDSGPVRAWGYSVTWDWPRWFVRIARDPKQNFSAQDAWRFAGGVRF